ncbi:Asp23/Gls24 family envelope stress response protein [Alicyclobacillaceae bacterium I2511]|jgi:uncharacterized alkaline shock family protein YloU|nr:Asp23/Gls24 family envelope stress response protein [Alicyclobacillaceae bacterium I2511]
MNDFEYHTADYPTTDLGKIQIADEVIQIIAGLAAGEITGVTDMSGSFAGGITESLLGRKNLSKGVKVTFGDEGKSCTIDLAIVLDFGVNIPQTCVQIQEHVKQTVEGMTGLEVIAVNVHVSAVAFQSDKAKDGKDNVDVITVERKNH